MIRQGHARTQNIVRIKQLLDVAHGLKHGGRKRPKHKRAQHHLSGRVQVIIMAILPCNIATRTAYGDDSCTGRFWEDRFK